MPDSLSYPASSTQPHIHVRNCITPPKTIFYTSHEAAQMYNTMVYGLRWKRCIYEGYLSIYIWGGTNNVDLTKFGH